MARTVLNREYVYGQTIVYDKQGNIASTGTRMDLPATKRYKATSISTKLSLPRKSKKRKKRRKRVLGSTPKGPTTLLGGT